VPLPIALAGEGPPVLALGGFLKNTICVMKARQAFLSQHIGGLDNVAAIGFLEETVRHLLAILDVCPAMIAHDLHPDFPSTRLALRLADEWGIPAIGVAHHHAHIAAICAEHALDGPMIGLALDGVGYGPDGGAWGGELLRLDAVQCVRLGHLQPLRLPGGDRAAREPWRMAVAALHATGRAGQVQGWLDSTYPGRDGGPLLAMLDRDLRCPPTSSLGRWFDAAAGLLGLRAESCYEGQAAMELEGLATRHGPVAALAGGFVLRAEGVLDLSPLVPVLLAETDPAHGAALFHATVAAALAAWVLPVIGRAAHPAVAVGGGCAMNQLLIRLLRGHLAAAGVALLEARQAPPNDGGLALGQAWVARHIASG
jgi:hydrogenase maturation protein HypF